MAQVNEDLHQVFEGFVLTDVSHTTSEDPDGACRFRVDETRRQVLVQPL
jgi:hypothetical protein